MKHQLLFVLLQVALVRTLSEVSGYLGENVTLRSGADPAWNLSKIEWSIFSNNTWIATYRGGKVVTERFYQYKGRLSLNSTTADLTITNLIRKDAMEYTVDLINAAGQDKTNKIKVTVKEHLQKPTIRKITCMPEKDGFWMGLQCSSADTGANISWSVKDPSVTLFQTCSEDISTVFAFVRHHSVEFTCTSRRNTEAAASVFTSVCSREKPVSSSRCRAGLFVFIGVLLGVFLTGLIGCFCGERIKAEWKRLTDRFSPSESSA